MKKYRLFLQKTVSGLTISQLILTQLFLAGFFILPTQQVLAVDTGFHIPSAFASNYGVTNPNNAFASDDVYAVFDNQSDWVDYITFGFSIPAGAIINGIEASLEGNRTSPRTVDVSLSWNNGSSWTSVKNVGSSYTTSDSVVVVGSAIDTWGRIWSVGEFSNFRVRVDAVTTGLGDILNLDQLQVKVYYAYTTGWKNPTNDTGNFNNPIRAYTDGGTPGYATADNSEVHQYFGYNFSSVPTGATINGIAVKMDAWRQSGQGKTGLIAVELSWNDGTNWTTTGNNQVLSDSEQPYTKGGESDTWGHSWTRAEIDNLRVRLTATTNGWIRLDWVPVIIYYTPVPPDTTLPTFTINESTDTGPVKTDTINISINEPVSLSEYGFSQDDICDASDTYGNSFSSGVDFAITGNHTEYLCIKATDLADNTGYILVGRLNTDNTAPEAYSVSIDQPYVNGTNKNALSFTFADAEINATYNYSIDDSNPATTAIEGSGTISSANQQITGIDISSLDDGTLALGVSLTDIAGNTGSDATDDVIKDVVAPTIIVNNQTTNDITPTITGTTNDSVDVSVTVNEKTYIAILNIPNWSVTIPDENALTDGLYPVSVSSTDAAGNTGSDEGSMTIDTEAPNLTLDTIMPNAAIITGTTDTDAIIDVNINGVDYQAELGETGTWSIAIPYLDENSYDVSVTATDPANNHANIHGTLIIDVTPPSVPVLKLPANGSETNISPILSWEASTDAVSLIKDYFVKAFLNGSELFNQNITAGTSYDTSKYNDEQGLFDGTYTWQVQARDNADNSSGWSELWQFIKDTLKPLISIETPATNSYHKYPINISGVATDNSAQTVKYVHLYYQKSGDEEPTEIDTNAELEGTQSLENETAEPFNYAYLWTPSGDGTYILGAVAEDKASNLSATSTVENVIYDTTLPTKPIANPAEGEYQNAVTVTLSSEDTNFDAIYYTIDGSEPNASSTAYSVPINISADTILKAIAYDKAGNISEIMTETYSIAPEISKQESSNPTETSITVTWTTNNPATSRVIYDTVSHPDPLTDPAPDYGYANSTVEDSTLVANHSVVISGLNIGTTYYLRTVSHGSPETVSGEITATTSTPPPVPPPPPAGGNGPPLLGNGGLTAPTVPPQTPPAQTPPLTQPIILASSETGQSTGSEAGGGQPSQSSFEQPAATGEEQPVSETGALSQAAALGENIPEQNPPASNQSLLAAIVTFGTGNWLYAFAFAAAILILGYGLYFGIRKSFKKSPKGKL